MVSSFVTEIEGLGSIPGRFRAASTLHSVETGPRANRIWSVEAFFMGQKTRMCGTLS
jgi:hypothetical protein